MSSANFSTLLVIVSPKSLTYIKNNKGPNTDSCGTPLKTDFQFETFPSTTTCFFCQSAIVLSSRLCHPRFHGLIFQYYSLMWHFVKSFLKEICEMISLENVSLQNVTSIVQTVARLTSRRIYEGERDYAKRRTFTGAPSSGPKTNQR